MTAIVFESSDGQEPDLEKFVSEDFRFAGILQHWLTDRYCDTKHGW